MNKKPSIEEKLLVYCFVELKWKEKYEQKKGIYTIVKKSTYAEKFKYSKNTITKLLGIFNEDYDSFIQNKKLIKKIKKTRIYKKQLLNYYLDKYNLNDMPQNVKIFCVTFFYTFVFVATIAELKTKGVIQIGIKMLFPTLLLGCDAFALRLISDMYNDLFFLDNLIVKIPILEKEIIIKKTCIKAIDNVSLSISWLCSVLAIFSFSFFIFCMFISIL